MTGIEALEALFNGEKIYRGYFKTEAEEWYISYNKGNKSFNFGSGWNEALKYKTNEQIMNFIFYVLYADHWKKYSDI